MPINSFDDYPMSFKPDRDQLRPPYYLSLANLLEAQIRSGILAPDTQLPPQRELADYLDLSLSTVTRAYALCEKKGLTYAVTGSGTFVSPNAGVSISVMDGQEELAPINMSTVTPFPEFNSQIAQMARDIYASTDFERLITYWSSAITDQRQIACRWLAGFGMDMTGKELFMTYGAQNALALILCGVFDSGDRLAVDAYSYPNFIRLAQQLHIQLIPIPGDAAGMLPEELEKVCAKQKLNGIYLTPTCQNPLGITMPLHRREALAHLIKKLDLLVIEDDVYGFLEKEPVPGFFALLPKRTLYVNSISKMLCGGLRTSFLVAPQRFAEQLRTAESSINLVMSPLLSELSTQLICSPQAAKIIDQKKQLCIQRNKEFDELFGPSPAPHPIPPFFRWLKLPEKFQKMNGTAFENLAKRAGVQVYHSHRFVIGSSSRKTPAYIRVSISSPPTSAEYQRGLELLHRFLYQNDSSQAPRLAQGSRPRAPRAGS